MNAIIPKSVTCIRCKVLLVIARSWTLVQCGACGKVTRLCWWDRA